MQQAQAPFHIMIKPRGPICNLACEYCYYLPKANLYPNTDFKMTRALLENLTQQMIAAQPGNQVTFSWQGGEPTLMGLDFFEAAVRLQNTFRSPGMQIANVFQTNGITLSDAWCRFFNANHFLVGLSLDGPACIHNRYRYNKLGQETFDSVMRAVRLLQKHHVDFNILCCVHKANVDRPLEVYRFLRDEVGAQFIQFIPIVQRQLDENEFETEGVTALSVSGKAYGEFLMTIFDEWVQRDVGQVFVQLFDIALGAWLGQPPSLCVFAETCGRALVLEHNGDLYACDHFVRPEYLLGNILEKPLLEMVESKEQQTFGTAKRDTLPQKCLDCKYRFLCNGGCPKNRDEHGLNLLCEGYQRFFHHIETPMNTMKDLWYRKRSPAEIMQMHKSKES